MSHGYTCRWLLSGAAGHAGKGRLQSKCIEADFLFIKQKTGLPMQNNAIQISDLG